jgi:general secretion pathway protein D
MIALYCRISLLLILLCLSPLSMADRADLMPPGLADAAANVNAPTRLWNFQNADIRTVINEIAKESHKNFIIDPRVQGKVTLVSAVPINASEAYQVFLTMLQTQGFSAIQNGDVIKIVPDSVAKFQEIPTLDALSPQASTSAALVVKIIPIQNINAAQLIPVLQPMLPATNQISVYNPTNSLIIATAANKLAQIEQVIHQLDQPNASNIEIVPLQYANATEIATTLKSLLPSAGMGQAALLIAADSNSNSVLVTGAPQDRQRIIQLIRKMDGLAANTATMSSTAVIYLKYLNAKDFVPVLRSIAMGVPVPVTSTTDNNSNNTNYSAAYKNIMNSVDQDSTPTPVPAQIPGMPSFNSSSTSNGLGNSIQIEAEPDTNAIIINGPPSQLRALKAVIAKLDTRPQQVLVEAVIVEVSENDMQNLGIEWGTLPPASQTLGTDSFSSLTGGLGVGIVDFGRFKAVVNFLAKDSSTNILSTPSLMVLDNQKATIKVGQKVSFVTGSYSSTNQVQGQTQGTVAPFTTTSRDDVALTLDVTPQISQGNAIRLTIKQGNQTLRGSDLVNGNPVTNESDVDTSVMIDSGQILVIGGLISNDLEESVQKVPLLGDIPLIGRAFQSRSHTFDKKNLLVFLRPVIVNDTQTAMQQTGQRYSVIRELQLERQQNADILLPANSTPVLQQWQPLQLPQPFTYTPHAT